MQLDITTYGRSSSNLVFALVLTAYMNNTIVTINENLKEASIAHTFIFWIRVGVASESLYVTGCHPRLSRSLDEERSHNVCVNVLRVISPSRPLCWIKKWEDF